MNERVVTPAYKADSECTMAICRAADIAEKIVEQQTAGKIYSARMSAVVRELKELAKVVANCGY